MKNPILITVFTFNLFVFTQHSYANVLDGSARLVLKNAYIDRDFEPSKIKDVGSWSQSASLFIQSGYTDTPLQIGLDASVQYALRLSDDKGVADTVLPFNTTTGKQAKDQLKYGATLKAKYQQAELKVGELWLNLPTTPVDESRQLFTSFQGAQLTFKAAPNVNIELGRVEKLSPRNEEKFRDLSYTLNGVTHRSDGLNYIDLKYQPTPQWHLEYYFGELESLFNRHYFGAEYRSQFDQVKSKTKLKYFHTIESNNSKLDAFTNQNIGIMQSFNYANHSLSAGYQQISGDNAYALLDGFVPELYFINWNVTGFFKEKEKTWHAIYSYKFDGPLKGLSATIKYSYGYDFIYKDFSNNKESELDVGLNYKFPHPKLNGWSLSYLFADYNSKNSNSFNENRGFLSYQKTFK
ncbi:MULTISPECIES: OprD family outer membrane porin [Acinetobacter]|jgi:benzoate transport porin|uniref:OprD family outer membrane porin n=1 Tax=Acinetobacter TaxID=469 RepID=UPI0004D46D4C|nr:MULTISPECIES: OprD family outer membrane porin [unclassified Acinetobacter]KEC83347.1 hypothetical protein DT74_16370 [Acinetobacter sp. ETR1]WEE40872.1 OprD family outer membrane porin [Acinetobacter sp. TAC-1]